MTGSRTLAGAMAMALAASAMPLGAETWVLPGGGGIEVGEAGGERRAIETPLGSGSAIELAREEADGVTSQRFSDGRIGEVEGVDLQAEFFFLTLEGLSEDTAIRLNGWDLERLRVGVPPGATFLGQTNETEVLQAVASLERFNGQLPGEAGEGS